MEKLRINFSDFWSDFDKENNLFTNLLRNEFDVEISSTPDILFYSCFGFEHLRYSCHKVFYTAENVRPNFNECDFSFTFDIESYGGRNFRMPLFRFNGDLEKLVSPKRDLAVENDNKFFCCMLVSNADCKFRNEFFEKLTKYKKVDSGGKYKNNIGGRVKDKDTFLRKYKFNLCFENSSYPGYTTEKIIEPFFASSIPIYWGNPQIGIEFNTKRFINIHDYASVEEAIQRIIEIDNDQVLYEEIINQPIYKNNVFPEHLSWKTIETNLTNVVNECRNITPVSQRMIFYLSSLNKIKKKLISRLTRKAHWYC